MKSLKLIEVMLAALLLSSPVFEGSPLRPANQGTCVDCLGVFRDFLLMFYPELRQPWVGITVREHNVFLGARGSEEVYFVSASTEEPNCGLSGHLAVSFETPREPETEAKCVETEERAHQLFRGYFVTTQSTGRVKAFGYSAPILDQKYQTLVRQVREHPEWSDREADEAMRQAGAKFGLWNRDALVGRIPVTGLAEFFGKVVIQSVRFRVRAENVVTDTGEPETQMLWEVRLKPSLAQKSVEYYWLLLDPFEGKLVTLGTNSQQ